MKIRTTKNRRLPCVKSSSNASRAFQSPSQLPIYEYYQPTLRTGDGLLGFPHKYHSLHKILHKILLAYSRRSSRFKHFCSGPKLGSLALLTSSYLSRQLGFLPRPSLQLSSLRLRWQILLDWSTKLKPITNWLSSQFTSIELSSLDFLKNEGHHNFETFW